MDYGICVDDNAHVTPQEAEDLGVGVVPLPILIGGKTAYEFEDLDPSSYYREMAKVDVKTSMASPEDTMRVWDRSLSEHDRLLYIPTSRSLSANIQMAEGLAQEEKYRGRVVIVDNHRMSVVLKCSLFDALKLRREGWSPEEVKRFLEEEQSFSKMYIALDTLKYLARGGRLTPAAARLGNLMNVKPVLKLEGGKLDAQGKAIGMPWAKKMMLGYLREDLKKEAFLADRSKVVFFAAYSDDREKAVEWAKQVEKAFCLEGKKVAVNPLSLSTGAHIGPGALAITVTKVVDEGVAEQIERRYAIA